MPMTFQVPVKNTAANACAEKQLHAGLDISELSFSLYGEAGPSEALGKIIKAIFPKIKKLKWRGRLLKTRVWKGKSWRFPMKGFFESLIRKGCCNGRF